MGCVVCLPCKQVHWKFLLREGGTVKFILDRLREPSTWAGVSALGLVFGLPPGLIDALAQVVMGVGGVAAIVMKDKAGE